RLPAGVEQQPLARIVLAEGNEVRGLAARRFGREHPAHVTVGACGPRDLVQLHLASLDWRPWTPRRCSLRSAPPTSAAPRVSPSARTGGGGASSSRGSKRVRRAASSMSPPAPGWSRGR